jgi:branched-chain amino acid transport system substrate-binding protein
MNRSKLFLPCTLAVLTALAFTGCGKSGKNDVIKIGWAGSLSGDVAIWGTSEFNTMKMLVEEANAKGGLLGKTIEIVGYDTKGDPQETVNVVRRLTSEDHVVGIIGPNSSGCAIAATPTLAAAKVPLIATSATNPKVTVVNGQVNPYNFRACFIDPYQGSVAAGYALEKLKAKSAAVITNVGDDYSQGLSEFFVKYFQDHGGKVVSKEGFNNGDVDFRALLSKVKAARPDIIFVPTLFKEAALIANQARELGITTQLIGGDGWPSEQLFKMAGKAVEGSFVVNHLDYKDPDVADYKKRFSAKFGKDPELNAYLAYDAFTMLTDAIQRAASAEPEKVAQALNSCSIQGITGRIAISPSTHNPEGKVAVIEKCSDKELNLVEKFAPKL